MVTASKVSNHMEIHVDALNFKRLVCVCLQLWIYKDDQSIVPKVRVWLDGANLRKTSRTQAVLVSCGRTVALLMFVSLFVHEMNFLTNSGDASNIQSLNICR